MYRWTLQVPHSAPVGTRFQGLKAAARARLAHSGKVADPTDA
jgi:hypothetical protein